MADEAAVTALINGPKKWGLYVEAHPGLQEYDFSDADLRTIQSFEGTRDEAMARVEEAVVRSMGEALADWAIFRPQAKQPT